MKIRIFKTSSKSNPNRVHVGIPDDLKLNSNITEIQLNQTEVLSTPTSISDLARNPKVLSNKSLNAFKNVGVSKLTPGFKMTGTIKGALLPLQSPLEVEEIIIPPEFDHLDDVSSWLLYNYNTAYKLSDSDFDVLPGDKNLPTDIKYELKIKGKGLTVSHDTPVDNIAVYYKRVYKNSALEAYWIPLVILNNESESFEFPIFGEYNIRIVPHHAGKQLASFKEYRVLYEEEEKFEWNAIQIGSNRYQVRMEGILGSTITELDIFENGKRLSREKLQPDKNGRIEKSFVISNISDAKTPILKLQYYRTSGAFRSLVSTETRKLYASSAKEPIRLKVNRVDSNTFQLLINDPSNMLYAAINTISPFSGSNWQKAIQSQKYMAFVSIKRHQDGLVTNYGYYPINVTSGNEPKFLLNPPFTEKVTIVDNGFSFKFEDTKKFREIKNLDDPNLEKKITYEFRLLYWTTGIQECLNSGSDYIYSKETSILVKNKRRAYKYSYSIWKEEHPIRKYENRIPVDVEYAYLGGHISHSRSAIGHVLTSSHQPVVETSNILINSKGWRVLYFYNDKDDEIQTFPYSSFSIEVPSSSQLSINKIRVSIENSEEGNVILGEYHPGDVIEIVDFLGYYEARKFVTKTIDVQSAVSEAVSASTKGMEFSSTKTASKKSKVIFSTPAKMLNTAKKMNSIKKNNSNLNKTITEVIETGTLSYTIDIEYKSGKTQTMKHSEDIENIPKLPPEPENNQSVSIGNKTITRDLEVAYPLAVSKISTKIQTTTLKRSSKAGRR